MHGLSRVLEGVDGGVYSGHVAMIGKAEVAFGADDQVFMNGYPHPPGKLYAIC